MFKKTVVMLIISIMLLSGCNNTEVQDTPAPPTQNSEIVPPSATNEDTAEQSEPNKENSIAQDLLDEEAEYSQVQEITPSQIDLSDYFGEFEGTAVLFSPGNYEYVYNEEMANTRFSPYSTFKIVSTLMGLHEGVVTSEESTMNYNGTKYWYEPWNANLNLLEAFQNSCVWYYHQLVYQIPQHTVQEQLDNLDYGNCDISEWEGNGSNSQADLNGFWLDSSLKISPREQVYLLQEIFENKTIYDDVDLLMRLMDTQTQSIFAKTGSGSDESWYVGFFDNDGKKVYFAVFIQGDDVSGAVAKDIAISIVDDIETITTQE